MKLIIKNWSKFQHYRKRRPPWIKLYRDILDDYRFQSLPDASRALAPCLWLIASESLDGVIDMAPAEIAFRLRRTEPEILAALKPLAANDFIQDASGVLAACYSNAIPETEKSTEREAEKEREEGGHTGSGSAAEPPVVTHGKKRQPFIKPTPEDVTVYSAQIGYPLDGEAWCDAYAQKGWMVGKSPMKDWRAAVRNWKRCGYRIAGGGTNGQPAANSRSDEERGRRSSREYPEPTRTIPTI